MNKEELWHGDHRTALEALFVEFSERNPRQDCEYIWIHTSMVDKEGMRYFRFQDLEYRQLRGRRFALEFFDGAISILWLDVWFQPEETILIAPRAPSELPAVHSAYESPCGVLEVLYIPLEGE